jgi:hypothetical protein
MIFFNCAFYQLVMHFEPGAAGSGSKIIFPDSDLAKRFASDWIRIHNIEIQEGY